MNPDFNDLKKKSKPHENRSDSSADNDVESYQGFKTSNSASFNSRRSYHQDRTPDRTLEKYDSMNFQKRRSSIGSLGTYDKSESNSSVDLMDAFSQMVFKIRAEVKKPYLTYESPKTTEDLKREMENKRREMLETSFLQKYGSKMTSVTELKWGSPIKPREREKKTCYTPTTSSSNLKPKSTPLRGPYDMPDSPTASISTDTFYGFDRASKRKAKDQISNFVSTDNVQSDEDNETVKDDFKEVTKKRKNHRGKNKNPQSKPPAKKNENNKNQKKLYFNNKDSVVDIEMEEEPVPSPAKEIVSVTDDEDEEMFISQSKKNMSLTKRMSLSTELLKKSQEEQSMEEQTRRDEEYARQLNEEEQADDKKMDADMASRSSAIPQSRNTRKNSYKQKEEQVLCPMCNKNFAKSRIENHAFDCQGVD